MRTSSLIICAFSALSSALLPGCTLDAEGNSQGLAENNANLHVLQYESGGRLYDYRWPENQQRNISYCIPSEFESEESGAEGNHHALLVRAMREAAWAWESVADVRFVYRADLDDDCNINTNVAFNLVSAAEDLDWERPREVLSFYANAPRDTRNLTIYPMMWETARAGNAERTPTGLLRHELGHALGFVDEQLASANIDDLEEFCRTAGENPRIREVSEYDRRSLMHYPECDGIDTHSDFALTDGDVDGVAALYGAALSRTAQDANWDPSRLWVADVNKDGKADLCYPGTAATGGDAALACSISQAGGNALKPASKYASIPSWGVDPSRRWLVDVTGDGEAELCVATYKGVSLNCVGRNTSITYYMSNWGSADARWMADINNDKKTDFCRQSGEYLSCSKSIKNGASDSPANVLRVGADWGPANGRWMADVDADGRADFCYRLEATPDLRRGGLRCYLTPTTGTNPKAITDFDMDGWGPLGPDYWLADVNADRRADLCRREDTDWGSYLNCALSLNVNTLQRTAVADWDRNAPTWMADINGDGRADLIRRVPGEDGVGQALGYTLIR